MFGPTSQITKAGDMPKLKITKIKNTFEAGEQLPISANAGIVGMSADRMLVKKGHNHNPGKGVDLPDFDTEHKARKSLSKSHHTIGRMSLEDIKQQSWCQTSVREKVLRQQRTTYDGDTCIIKESRIYDFDDPEIQAELERDYETAREKVLNGKHVDKTYVSGGEWVHLQKDSKQDMWQVRINNSAMKKMESRVLGAPVLKNSGLFEW